MKKFLIFLFTSLIVFGLGFPFVISAMAVSGWAWSSNIGWISLNRLNCDADGNNLSDGPPPCPSPGTFIPTYGVTLEPVVADTRSLTGFAWSPHIGWIHFNPAAPFPAAPPHTARVDSPHLATSTVSGWARVLAHNGGWTGWINMRGPAPDGVTVNFVTREFSGWAWSDMVVGWISFRGPGYGVTLINIPPEVRPPLEATANHCAAPQRYTFSWTFHDPGDTQTAFQIQVATGTVLAAPFKIDRRVTSTAHSYAPLDLFAWNTTYTWRVRVWDSHGATSTWSATTSFTTPVHRPPNVRFSFFPAVPIVNEVVHFTDESVCFGPGGVTATCTAWSWHFGPNATPTTSALQNPTTTFTTVGARSVRLTVTDPYTGPGNPAFSCTTTRSIVVGTAPPIWIEIPPIIWLRQLWAGIIAFINNL